MKRLKIYSNLFLLKAICLAFIAIVCPKTASSKETLQMIRLFKENGSPVSDYDKQIANLIEAKKQNKLPVVVQFSKGTVVTVYDINHGNQNLILDIGNQRVLRIRITKYRPLFFWNALLNPSSMVDSMYNFLSGYRTLKENNIPLPELYEFPGREREFLILEKLNIEFLYADYLNQQFVEQIPQEQREKIDREFLDFASKTIKFRNFGDFSAKQLAYTSDKGWVLFDFSNNHQVENSGEGNVFEYDKIDELVTRHSQYSSSPQEIIRKPGLPEHLRGQVRNLIAIKRGQKAPYNACQLIFGI